MGHVMIAVFDTNIVIDSLNGVLEADAEYTRYERVYLSRITWMEVLIGAEGDDSNLRSFLNTHFEVISLDLAIAETAIQLRRVTVFVYLMLLFGQLQKYMALCW